MAIFCNRLYIHNHIYKKLWPFRYTNFVRWHCRPPVSWITIEQYNNEKKIVLYTDGLCHTQWFWIGHCAHKRNCLNTNYGKTLILNKWNWTKKNFTPKKTIIKRPRRYYWDLNLLMTNDILKALLRRFLFSTGRALQSGNSLFRDLSNPWVSIWSNPWESVMNVMG